MAMDTLRLRDGRTLEFWVDGDAVGDLLVFHAGSWESATELPHVIRAAAARGLRVAFPSRPGYGGSTRQPERMVADSARDVAELADHLQVESFVVAGWSGGGPHALACAALLPTRVRACVTIAGVAPPDEAGAAWRAWASPEDLAEQKVLVTEDYEQLVATYDAQRQQIVDLTAEQLLDWPLNNAADRAALRDVDGAAEGLARMLRNGAATVWGFLDDWVAWARPWGFRMADIRVPVTIRHGDEDAVVSLAEAHWLARHVPGAHLQELPGGGHLSAGTPFDPVVATLLGDAER